MKRIKKPALKNKTPLGPMKTYIATSIEFDGSGCGETTVIGAFSSRKTAKAGIHKWTAARTFRPLHLILLHTCTLDKNGIEHTEHVKSIMKDAQTVDARQTPPAITSKRNTRPIYHAFRTIPETLTDGWLFGAITVYEDPDGCDSGDGFVVAPDGSRAGLDWRVGRGKIRKIAPPDERQWGVYEVFFPRPIRTTADLAGHFRAVLPQIKKVYHALQNAATKAKSATKSV